jgi:hypothetical protein
MVRGLLDLLFAVGQLLSIFALLLGAYLSITGAKHAAGGSGEPKKQDQLSMAAAEVSTQAIPDARPDPEAPLHLNALGGIYLNRWHLKYRSGRPGDVGIAKVLRAYRLAQGVSGLLIFGLLATIASCIA